MDLIKKWNQTGLIPENMDSLRKNLLASKLEECAKFLVDFSAKLKNSEEICGLALPVLSRYFIEKKIPDFQFNVSEFVLYLDHTYTTLYEPLMMVLKNDRNVESALSMISAKFYDDNP